MHKLLIAFLLLALSVSVLVFLSGGAPYAPPGTKLTNIFLGNLPLKVEIASSDTERRLGLGGRDGLEPDQGMLFVFEYPQKLSFWMRDMFFPIDIIWLDENYTVVDISKYVRPDTYPEIFSPKIPAQYVLEVNGGLSDSFGIEVGTRVTFSKNFLTN